MEKILGKHGKSAGTMPSGEVRFLWSGTTLSGHFGISSQESLLIDGVWEILKENNRPVEIWGTFYGYTVVCHCGPGTVGVMPLPR